MKKMYKGGQKMNLIHKVLAVVCSIAILIGANITSVSAASVEEQNVSRSDSHAASDSSAQAVAYSKDITVKVNGTPVAFTDVRPFIGAGGRTMIPLRAVADALHCQTLWDNEANTVTVNKPMTLDGQQETISLLFYPFESKYSAKITGYFTSKGKQIGLGVYNMDTNAVIKSGRTCLPIRYVAEYFGYKVGWDQNSRTVIINDGGSYGAGLIERYNASPKLTPEKLRSTRWISNGQRAVAIGLHTFFSDGSSNIVSMAGGAPWEETYTVNGNLVIEQDQYGKNYLDYDPATNMLISRNCKQFAARDYTDSNGNYVPPAYDRQFLIPYTGSFVPSTAR